MTGVARPRVLVIEDDRRTAELVGAYLRREGFEACFAADGREGLKAAIGVRPELVILDLMLPGMDGLEVCRRLRRASNVPILILTAREEEMDRVLGLSIGADDYVVKPFSPRELVARVRAILRRTRQLPAGRKVGVLRHRDLELDPSRRKVTHAGRRVELTPAEFELLEALMRSSGRVLSRQEILDRLHPDGEAVVDRLVDVHVANLRRKLGGGAAARRLIVTVRGAGYRFAEENEAP